MTLQKTEDLVALAKAGNRDAFNQLVQLYQKLALRTARRMINNESIIEDLVQEAMLQAYLSLGHLRENGHFSSWLQGIVRNVCRSHLRARGFDSLSLDAILAEVEASNLWHQPQSPHSLVVRWEMNALVRQAVDALTDENRQVILRYYFGQMSVKEIAEQIGISTSAVKNRLYRSRSLLRQRLFSMQVEHMSFKDERKETNAMVKITDIHAVTTPELENYIVFLVDEVSRRALALWVSRHEGDQILLQLRDATFDSPTTYHFTASVLNTLQATIEEVRMRRLGDSVICANVKVKNSTGTHAFDARPSDAIALAIHAKAAVYVADDVMAEAAKPLPDDFDGDAWKQKESHTLEDIEAMYGAVEAYVKVAMDELSRFTRRARRVWQLANEEAQKRNHGYLDTEHLLLGIIREEVGGFRVLRAMNVDSDDFNRVIDQTIKNGRDGDRPEGEPIIAPRLKQVIAFAADERRKLGVRYIGTEHLLLGIAREGKGLAAKILIDLNVEMDWLRSQILNHVRKT